MLVLAVLLVPADSVAQQSELVGLVRDSTGAEIPAVHVAVAGTEWWTETRADGRWGLRLPPGRWRLVFRRLGYRTAEWEGATPEAAAAGPLITVLVPEPIQLQGFSVRERNAPPMARTVTGASVRRAPPLGEPDVFRAVVLLPGVTQPNDLKGRIHLAGGASDETGVALDGHLLQDPFHLLGLLGAVNAAALDRTNVLVHHVPASRGGRTAGLIDLSTRNASSEPGTEAVLSLLSMGVTRWDPDLPAGVDLLASARVTYLGRLVEAAGIEDLPWYGYHDALLRLGRTQGSWRTELLGYTTRDRVRDPDLESRNDGTEYVPLHWGEHLLGLSVSRTTGWWRFDGRASFSRAFTGLDSRPVRATFIDAERDWASASAEVGRSGRRWRLLFGTALDWRRNDQTWEARGILDEVLSPNTPAFYSDVQELGTIAPYAEATVRLGDRWTLAVGERLWLADGGTFSAPGVRLHRTIGDRAAVQLNLERRFQFDAQSEEPLEGTISPPIFLLREPRRVDAAAITVESSAIPIPTAALGDLRVDVFARRYPDRPILRERSDDTPADDGSFPDFRRVASRAYGASLAARLEWEAGWVLEASYAWQRVREEHAPDEWSPTRWDAPHGFTALVNGPGPWGFDVTAVLQVRSGAAVTPIEGFTFAPAERDRFTLEPRYIEGLRNSLRLPGFDRLDLGVRRGWRARGADWTFFLQVLNVLGSSNPLGYDWNQYFARLPHVEEPDPGRSGLPILPSFGVEVAW